MWVENGRPVRLRRAQQERRDLQPVITAITHPLRHHQGQRSQSRRHRVSQRLLPAGQIHPIQLRRLQRAFVLHRQPGSVRPPLRPVVVARPRPQVARLAPLRLHQRQVKRSAAIHRAGQQPPIGRPGHAGQIMPQVRQSPPARPIRPRQPDLIVAALLRQIGQPRPIRRPARRTLAHPCRARNLPHLPAFNLHHAHIQPVQVGKRPEGVGNQPAVGRSLCVPHIACRIRRQRPRPMPLPVRQQQMHALIALHGQQQPPAIRHPHRTERPFREAANLARQPARRRGHIDMVIHREGQPLPIRRPLWRFIRPISHPCALRRHPPRPPARRRHHIHIRQLLPVPDEGNPAAVRRQRVVPHPVHRRR